MESLTSIMNKNLLVEEVMIKRGGFPIVNKNELLRETLEEMNKFGLGIACIIDNEDKLIGLITDGDIRRLILKVQKPISAIFVDDAISYSSKSFAKILENTSLKNT